MKQFDKSKIIVIKIGDIDSIREGLKEYRKLLDSDEVVRGSMFDVEFRAATTEGTRRLQVKDTRNFELLKEAFKYGTDGGEEYLKAFVKIEEDTEIYLSEAIFMAHAMEYKELHEDIIATTKAIVDFSRRHNDSDKLWVDNMRIFGIEGLFMLAKTNPEYTYLLGQYFISYWDEEHAMEYSNYLFYLLKERGWTPDMIKAYVHCDSRFMRTHMYINDMYWEESVNEHGTLGVHLKNNQDDYNLFRELLKERFVEMPVLAFSYDINLEEEDPVFDFFSSLMPLDIDEIEDIEDETFIKESYKEEAKKLKKEIITLTDRPLIVFTKEQIREQKRMGI